MGEILRPSMSSASTSLNSLCKLGGTLPKLHVAVNATLAGFTKADLFWMLGCLLVLAVGACWCLGFVGSVYASACNKHCKSSE